jgi:hypothetical protein
MFAMSCPAPLNGYGCADLHEYTTFDNIVLLFMATITLSDIVFTSRRDIVDGFGTNQNLLVAAELPVDTLTGSDALYGRASSSADSFFSGFDLFGLYLQADLRTGPDQSSSPLRFFPGFDNDLVVGEALSNRADDVATVITGITVGFNLFGGLILSTGLGCDTIKGKAVFENAGQPISEDVVGISVFEGGTVDTGPGSDTVTGEASGDGNSFIYGIASTSSNNGLIRTGDGSDCVTGLASNASINGLTAGIGGIRIDTGAHADVVTAKATVNGQRANGFGGDVVVDLGSGLDKLVGFGGVTADGGTGIDTWDLRGYQSSDFTITKTGGTTRAATFEGFGATANVSNFEVFLFDNGLFTYNMLPMSSMSYSSAQQGV